MTTEITQFQEELGTGTKLTYSKAQNLFHHACVSVRLH
uniref:Macaca fascicularis brain cDNA, clone: QflA-22673 n=1 Tax=Macaca fascicularis TaxID=9541 RepID=I7G7F8_MACFA|nr:unnamed protein product [Macaca fascicularis]